MNPKPFSKKVKQISMLAIHGKNKDKLNQDNIFLRQRY